MPQIDRKRTALIGVSVLAGVLAAIYGQPLIHGNDQAIGLIVTVFSVLAGFLVAIMAIVGDPMMLLPGSWRISSLQQEAMRRRLQRHRWLFYIYLITLGLIFVSMLVVKEAPCFTIIIERIYLGFATLGFILSLGLPTALMKLQEERASAVVMARRKKAGIKS